MKNPSLSDLSLTRELRVCAVCNCPTFWRNKGQRNLGMCPDHSRPIEPRSLPIILGELLKAFPATVIESYSQPAYRRGEYGQPEPTRVRGKFMISRIPWQVTELLPPADAGPCVQCGTTVRRYGAHARLHCLDCRPVTP